MTLQVQREIPLALLPFPIRQLREAAHYFAERAQRLIHSQTPWESLTLVLLNDASMAEVNSAIMHHIGPTDVITQRYDPLPGDPPGLIGELYINLDEVHRRKSPEHELLLYIAHGCDHLTGADDTTPSNRNRMRRRELGWIRDYFKFHHMDS